MNNPYAQLPAITALLADPRVAALPHALAAGSARAVVDAARAAIRAGAAPPADFVQATLDHAEQQRALAAVDGGSSPLSSHGFSQRVQC